MKVPAPTPDKKRKRDRKISFKPIIWQKEMNSRSSMYSGRAREMKATKAGVFRAGQMSATSKDNDSAEVKAARTSLLAKLEGVRHPKFRL